jgi:hypothetical protein
MTPEENTSEAPPSGSLTGDDVKTYATLAHVGTVVIALAWLALMWVPAIGLYLYFRRRDHAGLLRHHLAQASSLAIVLATYGLLARYVLWAADAPEFVRELLPIVVALVAAYPSWLANKAVRPFEAHRHPKALAWVPLA